MILAIDQGTTGTTCIVFDERPSRSARAYREFASTSRSPAGSSTTPARSGTVDARRRAARRSRDAGVRAGRARARSAITNQRETVCVWDPHSGEPLHRAIVWQDRRTRRALRAAARRRARGARARAHRPRARPLLLGDEDRLAARARRRPARARREGRAVFGTIDSWLAVQAHRRAPDRRDQRLAHAALSTSPPARWDPELLELFGVPAARAAARCVRAPARSRRRGPQALHGHARPLAGVAGDQQAALFGQACVDPGTGKNTYGTGSFVLLNTGFRAAASAAPGLLATVAWRIGDSHRLRAGGVDLRHRRGRAVAARRARDHRPRRRDRGARGSRCDGNDGVYFVPALTGLGSPHWDPHARGTIVGLTRGTHARAPRARDARGDRLPDRRRGPRDGGGLRAAARRAARRRRRERRTPG